MGGQRPPPAQTIEPLNSPSSIAKWRGRLARGAQRGCRARRPQPAGQTLRIESAQYVLVRRSPMISEVVYFTTSD